MNLSNILKIIIISYLCVSNSYADIYAYFQKIKHDPNALYAFFKNMPKGGELHYHFSGGIYAEDLLAVRDNYCINNGLAQKNQKSCHGTMLNDVSLNNNLYNSMIRAWSVKDFYPTTVTPTLHDQFFSVFHKFDLIAKEHTPELLATIIRRAAEQNELYLEIMAISSLYDFKIKFNTLNFVDLEQMRKSLLGLTAFKKNLQLHLQQTNNLMHSTRQILNCDHSNAEPACNVTIKLQYYVLREQSLESIFTQALTGFLIVQQTNNVVGINFVQAEDGYIALRDYNKHMQIISYLHSIYPNVHIALHAGELNAQDVTPENLRFHIKTAINVAGAERIGHGVAIAYENDVETTLKTMAMQHIPVEINLISNALILNVFGNQHPLLYYIKHNVPVVFSSDDEGVLRTDLTSQYVAAVLQHHLSYDIIKQINRNTLIYSFLSSKEKLLLQKQLDKKLLIFESQFL